MQHSSNTYNTGQGGTDGDQPPNYQAALAQHGERDVKQTSRPTLKDAHRRSIEDEARELPQGWVREWDSRQNHHFYVDTRAKPPRSIWTHPYDDPTYLSSLPEKHPARLHAARVQQLVQQQGNGTAAGASKTGAAAAPAKGPASGPPAPDHRGFLTKMHDKIAGGTKEEREARRKAEDEHEAELHRRYVERIQQIRQQGAPGQYAGQQGGVASNVYANGGYPAGYQAQYASPAVSYGRSGGMGYGVPLLGGLAGGMLLGDMMGGGMGMGGMGMGGMGMGMGGMGMGGMGMGMGGMGGMGGFGGDGGGFGGDGGGFGGDGGGFGGGDGGGGGF